MERCSPNAALSARQKPNITDAKQNEGRVLRKRRDISALTADVQAMSNAAAADQGVSLNVRPSSHKRALIRDDGTLGLSFRGLVARWQVAPQTANAKLVDADLPVEGDEIYRWATILQAEGISSEIAEVATRETHPDLFEDLLRPQAVATQLDVKDISTVRKLILSGVFPTEAYVTFGTRPIRHFRPAFVEQERRRRSPLRLV